MLIRTLLVVATAYAALLALLYFYQPRMLFLPGIPGRELEITPAAAGLDYREVWFETDDGERLHGWWLPHAQARATVLFSHGNAGNISHRIDSLRIFHELGVNVFIYDYRGYGQSSGRPTEAGLYRDAAAAWHWLTGTAAVDSGRIVLFGRSLGAAVAARLAGEVEPGGLIVESAFASVPERGAEIYPWLPVRWLSRLQFNTAEAIRKVDAPVLVVHSRDDEIIPIHHGRRVFEAAAEPKSFLEIRGDHNSGFLISGERYRTGLDAFLTRHLNMRPSD